MRFARPSWLFCAAALVSAVACQNNSPTTPSTGPAAIITITVAPNPVPSQLTNPIGPTYTLTWTTTLKEAGAVGGVVQSVRAVVYDGASGRVAASTVYDDKDLLVFVGENRIESGGTLDVPLQLSYVLSTLDPAANLTITTIVKDDRGNQVENSVLVKVT